jgi:hypothetical protein
MITSDMAVGDAVHIQSWLMRLSRGDTLHIMPGSADHTMLFHLIEYIEKDMLWFEGNLGQKRESMMKSDTKPGSLRMRKYRQRKSEKVLAQIRKYFEIHGHPDDKYKADNDAAQAVSQES